MQLRKGKVVFIGDTNTGKTSLVQRIQTDEFTNAQSIIGTTFSALTDEDRNVTLQFWDTDGYPRFHNFLPSYLRGSLIVVFCTDDIDVPASDRHLYRDRLLPCETFRLLQDMVEECCPQAHRIYCLTKIDELSSNKIKSNLSGLEEFAKDRSYCGSSDYSIMSTSAKTGKGVDDFLSHLYDIVIHETPDFVDVKVDSYRRPKQNCVLM